jgi:glycosyltransferase involved in cell wall biosynthesis
MRLVVNGSFLGRDATGLQRAARSLLQASLEIGLSAQVAAPPGVADPLVSRTPGPRVPPFTWRRVWEQAVLPVAAREGQVLSLTNTAPLAGHNAVWVHDLAPIVGRQWFVPAMRWYGRLVIAAARRAERVLTVSQQVGAELAAAGVQAPIEVVRPAVDVTFRAASDGEVRAALPRLGVRPPYVLLIGWPDPRKDAATAVAAHAAALRARSHQLVLTGLPRPVFTDVQIPASPTIRKLGFVTDSDLRALLTGAAALLYPSRYEGFGLPPLEAWRCGTPAIVSDLPAVWEATEGRAVYLTPGDVRAWTDAIVAAIDGQIAAPEPVTWAWQDAARRLLAAVQPSAAASR